jgi:hypothetical protein
MIRYSDEDFELLTEDTFGKIRSMIKLKGGEYAGDVDRLANFRNEAAGLDLPMEVIWHVYAYKHWCAVTQYVKDVLHGTERPRAEALSGRLDDIILYCILFKAMIEEREARAAETPRIY